MFVQLFTLVVSNSLTEMLPQYIEVYKAFSEISTTKFQKPPKSKFQQMLNDQ